MVVSTSTGLLGSKLIIHDIFNKKYNEYTYNYLDNYEYEKHINEYAHGIKGFPIFNKTEVEEGKKISDYTSAKTFLMPTAVKDPEKFTDAQHTNAEAKYPFIANKSQDWLLRRNSQMLQLNMGIQIIIKVHGNTLLTAGDIVECNISEQAAVKTEELGGETFDKIYKGPFLIQKIRHNFVIGGSHEMYLTLVKDSIETELAAVSDNNEPKPENIGSLYDDFYEMAEDDS
jgi:hypothetical protein